MLAILLLFADVLECLPSAVFRFDPTSAAGPLLVKVRRQYLLGNTALGYAGFSMGFILEQECLKSRRNRQFSIFLRLQSPLQ